MSLKLQSVHKSFTQGPVKLEVLKGLNLDIQNSEIVAVLGRSGSGKSTFLSLLAGLDKPTSGHIYVDDVEISKMSEKEITQFRAENIGIVFQQFHLLSHLTALENVLLPLEILRKPNAEKTAKELLSQVGLAERMHHHPSAMSGGECQRVAIARALSTKPKILLADEPSGSLDVETGENVLNVFFKIIKDYKMTTVFVTHSAELSGRCQRQLTLKNGVV